MPAPRPRRHLRHAALVLVVVSTGLSPIAGSGFWWDLARGRAVFDGSTAPARDLLTRGVQREADWLAGVPAYVVYQCAGLTGLAATKAVLVALLLWLLVRSGGLNHRDAATCVAGPGVVGALDAFDSVSRSVELLALVYVMNLADPDTGRPFRRTCATLVAVMAVWANVGQLSVIGVGAILSRLSTRREWILTGIAAGSVCLTPAGPAAIWDSIRLLIPRLAESASTLDATRFQSTVVAPWDTQVAAYACVCLISVAVLFCKERHHRACAIACLVIGIGWMARSNVAVCSVFLTLQTLNCVSRGAMNGDTRERNQAGRSSHTRLPTAAGLVALIAFCAATAGPFNGNCSLGFGLSPRLDIRLFESSLQSSQLRGSSFCIETRATGMLAWARANTPSLPQPDDIDDRALLGGRLHERFLLRKDLEEGLRNPQRREDGSLAGWWVPLQQRDTSLLIVPSDNTTLIRSLEPTWWKPLSLDSPLIPFGRAGDAGCARQLVRVLQERDFVEYGNWSYSPDAAWESRQHLDLWSILVRHGRWNAALRQARVFHAMQLHAAATRVLTQAVNDRNTEAIALHAKCRAELHWMERLAGHTPSARRGDSP